MGKSGKHNQIGAGKNTEDLLGSEDTARPIDSLAGTGYIPWFTVILS